MANFDITDFSNTLAEKVAQAARFLVAVNGGHRLASSGIAWGNGVIVTADHTVRRDEDLTVTLPNQQTVPARLIGRDPGSDLAVLHTETDGLAAPEYSDPASLQVGQMVLAVGRRGENGPSASFGVISALGGPWRTWRNGQLERFVRADLNLYPGSSGSALVDMQGRVIGMNTAGLTRNWSVTIPRSTIDYTVTALQTHGQVSRGFLGVGLHPVQLPDERTGLIVLSVEPGGPAASSGLLVGDILLALAGQSLGDTDDVQAQLGPERVGKEIPATISRGGSVLEIALMVGSRPKGRRK